ncbi:glutathione S-transferase family protein [sulfur-oxidizing endosymbiont of Gigantopelta aegis]|uniref:glutathione S-transferase family protein n=1 Tax=sulfur-oxidizing endosymbiont of Gigantopelta aegis TaxID=2794934 RepID=UPI0018DD01B1|nr:glutathione S-transferase family protein [sulfur-oxidizing endosymbiont of Gigantopelta aegis]
MKLTLYGFPQTRSMRVQWLLEEMALDYEFVEINIFQGEGFAKTYRRIHPHGQVPALDVDGKIMFESGAICHWLADQFPEKCLAPAINEPLRMDYEQWMFYAPSTLEPPAFQYLLHSVLLPEEQRIAEIVEWNKTTYLKLIKTLNRLLKNKQYLLGEQFSTADIMLGYLLLWFPKHLEGLPALNDYCQRLSGREAYKKIIDSF